MLNVRFARRSLTKSVTLSHLAETPLPMDTFLIDVPMPAMGATVNELTVVTLKVAPGAQVGKGQKLAELESDKSIFEFESPCDGTVRAILGKAGDVMTSGSTFLQIETADASLKHLKSKASGAAPASAASPLSPVSGPQSPVIWTPRATKLALAMERSLGFGAIQPLLYRDDKDPTAVLDRNPDLAARVHARLDRALARAVEVLNQNRDGLDALVKALFDAQALDGVAVTRLLKFGDRAGIS